MDSSRSTQAAGAKGTRTRAGALAAAATLVVGLAGCSANYVENSQASVLLVVESINGGAPILSDVRTTAGTDETIVNCDTDIDVALILKNASANAVPGPSEAVTISRYEVAYTRSDGRGAEGVDVPYRIVGPASFTIAPGEDGSFPVTIVRHQAKLEPPLVNIDGASLITMAARVTLYGETISGEGVSGSGSVQVTFADFAEGADTCEGQ